MKRHSRAEILDWDRRHVWRPYTQMQSRLDGPPPLVIDRAEGVYLYDDAGKSYLDGNGSWWVSNLGHGHPRLRAALHDQIDHLAHCSLAGIAHEQAAALASELVEVTPEGLEHVFYSDDGSTAVEVALKMAFQYFRQNGAPERKRFLSFQNAFHGETVGCVSVGGMSIFHSLYEPLLFDVTLAPAPGASTTDEPWWDHVVAAVEETLSEAGDQFAGVIVEPLVQGAAGMLMYPPAVLRRLYDATRAAGALFIADEVFVGMGRTGTLWACEQAGISPDFLCSSKGLAGGMLPFAVTLTTAEIFAGFLGAPDSGRTFYYGHSYCGNPLGCRVAREVLAVMADEAVLDNVAARAAQMAEGLEALTQLPTVTASRQTGLIGAVELAADGAAGYLDRSGWRVYDAALELGAYLRPLGNVVYFVPALTITESELADLLQIARDSVKAAHSNSFSVKS